MVINSKAPVNSSRLRPLNLPVAIQVDPDENGEPCAIYLSNRRHEVQGVVERWRIDEEWWREQPISRLYYRLLLEGGATVDVFHDLVGGGWAKQSY